ncbi:hypothetical protein ACJX0J_033486, partial [Zea mays]
QNDMWCGIMFTCSAFIDSEAEGTGLNMVSAMFFQQDLLAVNFAAPLYLLILVDSVKIHICIFLIIYPFHSLVEEVNCLFLLEEVATIRYFVARIFDIAIG